jgi:hypothetical protein
MDHYRFEKQGCDALRRVAGIYSVFPGVPRPTEDHREPVGRMCFSFAYLDNPLAVLVSRRRLFVYLAPVFGRDPVTAIRPARGFSSPD